MIPSDQNIHGIYQDFWEHLSNALLQNTVPLVISNQNIAVACNL